mmetsp:Transcript_105625/g.182136  ORF Transcript_105625/g.182136 Transcript_105625/m.182136 type:complete len:298 (-) Transcript_105625:1418-2311(-)
MLHDVRYLQVPWRKRLKQLGCPLTASSGIAQINVNGAAVTIRRQFAVGNPHEHADDWVGLLQHRLVVPHHVDGRVELSALLLCCRPLGQKGSHLLISSLQLYLQAMDDLSESMCFLIRRLPEVQKLHDRGKCFWCRVGFCQHLHLLRLCGFADFIGSEGVRLMQHFVRSYLLYQVCGPLALLHQKAVESGAEHSRLLLLIFVEAIHKTPIRSNQLLKGTTEHVHAYLPSVGQELDLQRGCHQSCCSLLYPFSSPQQSWLRHANFVGLHERVHHSLTHLVMASTDLHLLLGAGYLQGL